MNKALYIVVVFLSLLLSTGCTAQKETGKPAAGKEATQKDKSPALQFFIDGSLKESKGEYADAILDYQEALRYDKDPAIYFALAKNYSLLRRHALAIENGREAVRLDSANITYRETLAGIYLNAGQPDGAAMQYNSILRMDSSNVNSMFNLAQILERTRPFQALEMYQRLVQRNGPTWEVLFQIGQLNIALRRYDSAAVTFEQMLKLDPSNLVLKQNLADMYVRSNKIDKAIAVFTDLLEINPTSVDLHGALGELYLQKDNWTKAREQFEIVLQDDSLTADTRFRVGMAYFGQVQKDSTVLPDAVDQFKTFADKYPDDWRAMLYLGVLLRLAKDDSTAQKYLTKATQMAGWNPDSWWQLGWLHFDKQRYDETISLMERARQLLPNEFRIHLLLGIAYSRTQRNEDAIVALERAIELSPNDMNALSSLGLVYDALKRYDKSDSTYERALRIDSTYSLVLNNYAYSLSERGVQLERSKRMSLKSLEKDSLNPSYLDTYGWIMFKMGRYTEAEKYISKAIEQGEVSAVVLEHLGDVYAKLNLPGKAKEYWSRALELDQKNAVLKEKISRGTL